MPVVCGLAVSSHARQEGVEAVDDAEHIDVQQPFPVTPRRLLEPGYGEGARIVGE